MTRVICGVDVASSSLAARIGQDGAAADFPNTAEGIAALAAFCASHQVDLVAMEATGGYEQRAFAQLSEHGVGVAVVNPRAVRQFAQSMGWLEKTDKIDAGMIAWYAEVKKSQPLCLAPETQLELRARVTRLRQLTEVRTAQLNQQRLVINPAIQRIDKRVLRIKKKIVVVDDGLVLLRVPEPLRLLRHDVVLHLHHLPGQCVQIPPPRIRRRLQRRFWCCHLEVLRLLFQMFCADPSRRHNQRRHRGCCPKPHRDMKRATLSNNLRPEGEGHRLYPTRRLPTGGMSRHSLARACGGRNRDQHDDSCTQKR